MSWQLCNPLFRKKRNRVVSQRENEAVFNGLKEASRLFQTNENIMKWGYHKPEHAAETFNWLFNKYVHKELDLDVNPITKKDIKIFKMGIKEFSKDLGKTGKRQWWSFFKIPAAMMRKIPELQQYQDELLREASFFRRYKIENEAHNQLIVDNWVKLAGEMGGKASIKEFQTLERELDAVSSIQNPTPEQANKKNQLRKQYGQFIKDGANPVFRDFSDVMHGVDVETLQGYTPSQKAMFREIEGSVKQIRINGVKIMSSALSKVMETAKMLDKREGSYRNLENTMELIKSEIKAIEFQSKIDLEASRPSQADFHAESGMEVLGFKVGDPVYLKKYMPHKLLGMVKMIKDGHRMMLNGDKNKTQKELLEQDWDNFRRSVESATHRSVLAENPYFSRDPAFFFRQYTHEISQFNFQAHLENNYRKQINHLMSLSEKAVNENDAQLEKATEAIFKQMRDMKETLVNIDPASDTSLAHLSRMITSIQYFRLMGGNVRSAARNATQRMYEFVHFGFKAHNTGRGFYRGAGGTNNRQMADAEAKRHGLLWHKEGAKSPLSKAVVQAEVTRGAIAEGSNIPAGYKVGTDGVLRHSESTSILKKGAEGAAKVSTKFGFFHRKVEEYNRKSTFDVAFALAYMNLKNAPNSWLAKQMKIDPSRTKQEGWDGIKDKWVQRRAGNVAYNAVTDIHFEYSKWAKAPGIRGPGGQVVGQFLHYRFSLLDLMSRWWKDGVKAMKAGDFNREEAWRLYRLGILQTMITGASVGFNVQLASLFQNDVVETADRIWSFLSADREDPEEMEELEQKTFSQGVMSFAGPTVGHALQFGEWMNWMELDHNGFPHHPTQQIVDTGDDFKRRQRWKGRQLINSQAARTLTYTYPIAQKQGIIDAFTLEFGLFPKKKLRDKKKAINRLTREHIPGNWRNLESWGWPLGKGLFPDITVADRKTPRGLKRGRKGAVAGPSKNPHQKVSPYELSRVLGSLKYLQGEASPSSVLRDVRDRQGG
tara:strand:+ start:12007 stop:14991 length:2985 start_codon:yes stop_codon:yes gene_type:complete